MQVDPHQVRAIIFDCDGTLADTMPARYEAWMAILDHYGLEMSEDRFYALGGWPTRRVADLLIAARRACMDSVDVRNFHTPRRVTGS